jgi:hypothetical protein
VFIQKIIPAEVKTVKIMSKLIGVRGNNMNLSTLSLFNHMTDDDFMAIHKAGQLKNLCQALSIDLQPQEDEESKTYTA